MTSARCLRDDFSRLTPSSRRRLWSRCRPTRSTSSASASSCRCRRRRRRRRWRSSWTSSTPTGVTLAATRATSRRRAEKIRRVDRRTERRARCKRHLKDKKSLLIRINGAYGMLHRSSKYSTVFWLLYFSYNLLLVMATCYHLMVC